MGRWSRRAAEVFAASLGVGPGARWIDAGCGTGALAGAVAARCRPGLVLGVDRSAAFVAAARAATAPAGTPGPVFAVADAQALPVRDGAFDAAVSALALNFPARPRRGGRGGGPGGAAGRAGRRVRLGLRRRHGVPGALLGTRPSPWTRRRPRWTSAAASPVPARSRCGRCGRGPG
ncbi:methyltransferase domain-containing protein, partial [Streptomyces sp. C]|uniref:class I SAM-dependent methyltransferase n=1 Tax=Streptomyces sp. C TaxID=253839 RepID=UPI001F511539